VSSRLGAKSGTSAFANNWRASRAAAEHARPRRMPAGLATAPYSHAKKGGHGETWFPPWRRAMRSRCPRHESNMRTRFRNQRAETLFAGTTPPPSDVRARKCASGGEASQRRPDLEEKRARPLLLVGRAPAPSERAVTSGDREATRASLPICDFGPHDEAPCRRDALRRGRRIRLRRLR
jgi:hypothetical protein